MRCKLRAGLSMEGPADSVGVVVTAQLGGGHEVAGGAGGRHVGGTSRGRADGGGERRGAVREVRGAAVDWCSLGQIVRGCQVKFEERERA